MKRNSPSLRLLISQQLEPLHMLMQIKHGTNLRINVTSTRKFMQFTCTYIYLCIAECKTEFFNGSQLIGRAQSVADN